MFDGTVADQVSPSAISLSDAHWNEAASIKPWLESLNQTLPDPLNESQSPSQSTRRVRLESIFRKSKELHTSHINRNGAFVVVGPSVHRPGNGLASSDGGSYPVACAATLVAGEVGRVECN